MSVSLPVPAATTHDGTIWQDTAERVNGGTGSVADLRNCIYRIARQALGEGDLDDLLQEISKKVARTLDVTYCEVLELCEDESLVLQAGAGFDEGLIGRISVGINLESQAGYTLLRRRPVVVCDLDAEERFEPGHLLIDHGVRSGVTVPLRRILGPEEKGAEMRGAVSHDYGVLGVHSIARRTFTGPEVEFLEEVAEILSEAIARHRKELVRQRELRALRGDTARMSREGELIREALEMLGAARDAQMVAECAVQVAVPTLADWCFVDLLEEDHDGHNSGGNSGGNSERSSGRRIRRRAVGHGADSEEAREISEALLGHYPIDLSARRGTARVFRTGQSELIPEVDDDLVRSVARDDHSLAAIRSLSATSYLGLPLKHNDGRLAGVLSLIRTTSDEARDSHSTGSYGPYGVEDERLGQQLAMVVSMALSSSRMSALPSAPEQADVVAYGMAQNQQVQQTHMTQSAVPVRHKQQSESLRGREVLCELSPRQREVFEELAELKSNQEIASKLYTEPGTIKSHIHQIRTKLGIDTKSELERLAQSIFHTPLHGGHVPEQISQKEI